MRIAFYAPFKPLNHPNPSGDLMIARGIVASLEEQGHEVRVMSRLRCRWIFRSVPLLLEALREQKRIARLLARKPVDCWLTYHCYYKSPDLLGPAVTKALGIPYVICQGSYATKFRKRAATAPGFLLNRKALTSADLLISDRARDIFNLRRIIPPEKLHILKPGIDTTKFTFDQNARTEMRKQWNSRERPVILSAAMFRSDVKSRGIARVIESCIRLYTERTPFQLIIAGDGPERERLEKLAAPLPPDTVLFTGKIPENSMYRFYSGGDLFAFPGFNESLGMVFLEAQSCGLPVVACNNGGVPEAVADKQSGLLAPVHDSKMFTDYIKILLNDPGLRQKMGDYAARRIRRDFDKKLNHRNIGSLLTDVVRKYNQEVNAP